MKKVLMPIAEGFEELEAITVIDLLRRAQFDVTVASLGNRLVKASRGTVVQADTYLDDVLHHDYDMIVLPGGLPGADHLRDDPRIIRAITQQHQQKKALAAICAAPKVLAHAGLLKSKKATSFPNAIPAEDLEGVDYQEQAVVVDGNIITSRGPGTAMDFALVLIEYLGGKSLRDEVEAPLQRIHN